MLRPTPDPATIRVTSMGSPRTSAAERMTSKATYPARVPHPSAAPDGPKWVAILSGSWKTTHTSVATLTTTTIPYRVQALIEGPSPSPSTVIPLLHHDALARWRPGPVSYTHLTLPTILRV